MTCRQLLKCPTNKPFHSMQVRSVTSVMFKAVLDSIRVSGGKLQFKRSDWHFKRQKKSAILIKPICSAQLLFMWKGMVVCYQFALSFLQIVHYSQAWSDQTYGQKATYSLILITHFGPCFKLTFSTCKVTWSPDNKGHGYLRCLCSYKGIEMLWDC